MCNPFEYDKTFKSWIKCDSPCPFGGRAQPMLTSSSKQADFLDGFMLGFMISILEVHNFVKTRTWDLDNIIAFLLKLESTPKLHCCLNLNIFKYSKQRSITFLKGQKLSHIFQTKWSILIGYKQWIIHNFFIWGSIHLLDKRAILQ
jgi:hypothetical protein